MTSNFPRWILYGPVTVQSLAEQCGAYVHLNREFCKTYSVIKRCSKEFRRWIERHHFTLGKWCKVWERWTGVRDSAGSSLAWPESTFISKVYLVLNRLIQTLSEEVPRTDQ